MCSSDLDDILLLDIPLPFLCSNNQLKKIGELESSSTKNVCLYETTNREYFDRLTKAGIKHFFPKTNDFQKLLQDLNFIHSNT